MRCEWKQVTLNDITDVLGDGIHGTPIYSPAGEYAFINGNNLVNGQIQIKNSTKRVDITEFEKHKRPLSNRTILVSINGTLGNVAVYRGEKIILGKSACYFNVSENVDKDFIQFVIMSPDFQSYFQRSHCSFSSNIFRTVFTGSPMTLSLSPSVFSTNGFNRSSCIPYAPAFPNQSREAT